MSKALPKDGGTFGLSRGCYQGPALRSGLYPYEGQGNWATLGFSLYCRGNSLVHVLQQNGVDEIRHGYLYISLYSNGLPVKYLDEDGYALESVTRRFDAVRCAFR